MKTIPDDKLLAYIKEYNKVIGKRIVTGTVIYKNLQRKKDTAMHSAIKMLSWSWFQDHGIVSNVLVRIRKTSPVVSWRGF